jgi:hypothetical protein
VKDTIVVNDRWGHVRCEHGDYYDCADRYHPCESVCYSQHGCQAEMNCIVRTYCNIINNMSAAVLQKHKYESGATLDKLSWGYRRNTNFTTDFLNIENLIWQLVSTVRYDTKIKSTSRIQILLSFTLQLWRKPPC